MSSSSSSVATNSVAHDDDERITTTTATTTAKTARVVSSNDSVTAACVLGDAWFLGRANGTLEVRRDGGDTSRNAHVDGVLVGVVAVGDAVVASIARRRGGALVLVRLDNDDGSPTIADERTSPDDDEDNDAKWEFDARSPPPFSTRLDDDDDEKGECAVVFACATNHSDESARFLVATVSSDSSRLSVVPLVDHVDDRDLRVGGRLVV